MMIDLPGRSRFVVARALLALLLLTSTFSAAAGQAAMERTLPFARGEQLVYQAEFKPYCAALTLPSFDSQQTLNA